MILVDTSVWIRAIARKSPYFEDLRTLLEIKSVVAHDFVYGELLIGDRGGRTAFLAKYAAIPQSPIAPHKDVVELARRSELPGKGLGWVDVHLLAAALAYGHRVWTADSRFAALAQELGVGWPVIKS